MDLTNLNDLKSFLGKFRIRLSKKMGQHFLVDRTVLDKIIKTANLKKTDTILEIGPGVGTLTIELAKQSRKVIAVEKDKRLLIPLQSVLRGFSNVRIINEDILNYSLPTTNYKLIADIPYYITGEVIKRFLTAKVKPSLIVLLVQKEVAKRIVAGPGKMSLLALSVQLYGDPEIIADVPRSVFFPAPDVDSAILKIEVFKKTKIEVDEKDFFHLLKMGFSSKRKTLLNNLSAGYKLAKDGVLLHLRNAGIKDNARAQELSLSNWKNLLNEIQGL